MVLNESDKIFVGSDEVDKIYVGTHEVYSASSLPSWLPQQDVLNSRLANTPPGTAYWGDFAFQTRTTAREFIYVRAWVNPDTPCQLTASSNYYSIFTYPYNSSFRGFSYKTFSYNSSSATWDSGVQYNSKEGADLASYGLYTFVHKAIISSSFSALVNTTGESNWEDYR